jgi:putative transposase
MSHAPFHRSRWTIADQPYFVTLLTVRRAPLFAEFDTARRVIDEMRKLHDRRDLDLLAWVLMPDQLQWLFFFRNRTSVHSAMRRFKSRSTLTVYRRRSWRRPVWQRVHCQRAIRVDEELHGVARYIISNPVRARLVDRLGDYPHWDSAWL